MSKSVRKWPHCLTLAFFFMCEQHLIFLTTSCLLTSLFPWVPLCIVIFSSCLHFFHHFVLCALKYTITLKFYLLSCADGFHLLILYPFSWSYQLSIANDFLNCIFNWILHYTQFTYIPTRHCHLPYYYW